MGSVGERAPARHVTEKAFSRLEIGMSRLRAHSEAVQCDAIPLESEFAVLQYLKCQCRRRVVEDDDVETVGSDVSGKSLDYAAEPRSCINANGRAIDQNRDVDIAVGAGTSGHLGSEKESSLDLRQRFCSVGDGAQ
jgi:hypothetical protein